MQSEPVRSPTPDTPESIPASTPEPVLTPAPVPTPSPAKRSVASIFAGIFICILLAAVAGLGYWAYQLNAELKATQGGLATLQGKYDTLTTDKNKLAADLKQTTATLKKTTETLEKTKKELSTAQSNLTKSKGETAALRTKMNKAKALVNVMVAAWVNSENEKGVTKDIVATGDSKLKELWDAAITKRDKEAWNEWEDYMIETVAALLE